MAYFMIHGESQMLVSEKGCYANLHEDGEAWDNTATLFGSVEEGRQAVVDWARRELAQAKAKLKKGATVDVLRCSEPAWVCTFHVEDDGELAEEGLRSALHGVEVPEDLSSSEFSRLYVKASDGWVCGCDNGMSVGFEFCSSFDGAYAFASREGALAAVEGLELGSYALVEIELAVSKVEMSGHRDEELDFLAANAERSRLRQFVPEAALGAVSKKIVL
jgi:hypothetical protein